MECIGSDMSNNSNNDQKSDDPEDMRVVLQEAKTRAKAKNMQELAENVARKLSKQHPKKEKIEDHYRQSGYPEGGADTDGQEQENKGKDNATEGSEKTDDDETGEQKQLSKTDMTDPDALENAFGPKRNEEERPVMSGKRQLDRAAASPTYTAPDGTKHKQKDYDPYKERLQKGWNERRDNALGLQPGSTWRGTGKPLTDAEKKEQENVGKLPSLKDDPKGRLQHEATKAGGKLAGKAIGKIAESGTVVSALLIYGLAFANDFPDVGLKVVEWFTFGAGTIADFIFDVVVTLGFRYFLRSSINIPGIKALLYSASFLEMLPGPQDALPFWTICAWICLRKIKEEQESQEQLGISREYAAKRRREDLENQWSKYGGGTREAAATA
ncbi:MAG: hypothetical protein UW39_C0011G0013 [Parcubacteria group bacterium GW2011_GWC2_44_17]|nr:MAG: hypothetical protein UW39_C0011G0013 [Parcubacteria group bacterium GW2011_GWC2_44_17]KKT48556.1 MAG: hypothetical protein UW40_C0039G0002 [Parcubacteria group bacterium GW2011_GWF2_44_17]